MCNSKYTIVAIARRQNLQADRRAIGGCKRDGQGRRARDVGKASLGDQDRDDRLIFAVEPNAPHACGRRQDRQGGPDQRIDIGAGFLKLRRSPQSALGLSQRFPV